MTAEQPDAASPNAGSMARPFRRRGSDRVMGGVAAGIADYFKIDPLLIRAVFVGLMIFGGAGLALYLGAWLLIPVEGRDDSIAESSLRRIGIGPRTIGIIMLFLLAFAYLTQPVMFPADGYVGFGSVYIDLRLFLILALVLVGIVLLRRGRMAPRETVTTRTGVEATTSRPVERTVVVREPRPHVPRGPLGWYVIAATFLAIGVAALVGITSDVTVVPGQFFGVALTIVGIGLVVGSWWGNARLLILPTLLNLPIGWAASHMIVPLDGGTGEQTFAPVSVQELRDEYRMLGGQLTIDLRDLEAGDEPIRINASISFGALTVLLPAAAQVELDSQVGAGGSSILGNSLAGTHIAERYVRGEAGPQFVMDLGAGFGHVAVEEEN